MARASYIWLKFHGKWNPPPTPSCALLRSFVRSFGRSFGLPVCRFVGRANNNPIHPKALLSMFRVSRVCVCALRCVACACHWRAVFAPFSPASLSFLRAIRTTRGANLSLPSPPFFTLDGRGVQREKDVIKTGRKGERGKERRRRRKEGGIGIKGPIQGYIETHTHTHNINKI